MALYEILQRFNPDGALQGSHVIEWDGNRPGLARKVTADDAASISETIDSAHLLKITELNTRITELEGEAETTATAHAAEIAKLKGLPAPDSVECEALQMALVYFGSSVAAVDTVIGALPSPNKEIATIRWSNLAGGIRRDHAFVILVSAGLGWPDEKIDALFALGRKLQADKDYTPTADDIYSGN